MITLRHFARLLLILFCVTPPALNGMDSVPRWIVLPMEDEFRVNDPQLGICQPMGFTVMANEGGVESTGDVEIELPPKDKVVLKLQFEEAPLEYYRYLLSACQGKSKDEVDDIIAQFAEKRFGLLINLASRLGERLVGISLTGIVLSPVEVDCIGARLRYYAPCLKVVEYGETSIFRSPLHLLDCVTMVDCLGAFYAMPSELRLAFPGKTFVPNGRLPLEGGSIYEELCELCSGNIAASGVAKILELCEISREGIFASASGIEHSVREVGKSRHQREREGEYAHQRDGSGAAYDRHHLMMTDEEFDEATLAVMRQSKQEHEAQQRRVHFDDGNGSCSSSGHVVSGKRDDDSASSSSGSGDTEVGESLVEEPDPEVLHTLASFLREDIGQSGGLQPLQSSWISRPPAVLRSNWLAEHAYRPHAPRSKQPKNERLMGWEGFILERTLDEQGHLYVVARLEGCFQNGHDGTGIALAEARQPEHATEADSEHMHLALTFADSPVTKLYTCVEAELLKRTIEQRMQVFGSIPLATKTLVVKNSTFLHPYEITQLGLAWENLGVENIVFDGCVLRSMPRLPASVVRVGLHRTSICDLGSLQQALLDERLANLRDVQLARINNHEARTIPAFLLAQCQGHGEGGSAIEYRNRVMDLLGLAAGQKFEPFAFSILAATVGQHYGGREDFVVTDQFSLQEDHEPTGEGSSETPPAAAPLAWQLISMNVDWNAVDWESQSSMRRLPIQCIFSGDPNGAGKGNQSWWELIAQAEEFGSTPFQEMGLTPSVTCEIHASRRLTLDEIAALQRQLAEDSAGAIEVNGVLTGGVLSSAAPPVTSVGQYTAAW